MGQTLTELSEIAQLREATRVRLAPRVIDGLKGLAECYAACGDQDDRVMAEGLKVLIEMHDKLEAIRHGQA